VWYWNEGE